MFPLVPKLQFGNTIAEKLSFSFITKRFGSGYKPEPAQSEQLKN
ncbi:hypothetical protein BROSI_A3654 [Candidatus Brocadia sinica JPN1]|uniref:Uncharacterized protein n=1 Tax=Candidatus Brocadia sinica JPN1 TaxID=1197129 RepID=A0ABQ0K217_9BACT|nr:hypothetical protein BROSI_A3654 [Candidatus Brocadia sinica JPN1]